MNAPQFVALFVFGWALVVLAVRRARGDWRPVLSWAIPAALLGLAFENAHALHPWQRLVLTTGGMLYALKATLLLREPPQGSLTGTLLFMTVWPGMDPHPFRERTRPTPGRPRRGLAFMASGFSLGIGLCLAGPALSDEVVGWCGIAACFLVIHFGYSEILTWALRRLGWAVPPLFHDPLESTSLSDFWSRRWNLAFVEMNKLIFLPALRQFLDARSALIAVFLVSGLLHECAVSYPVQAGWGGPLAYFSMQAMGMLAEHRLHRERRWKRPVALAWTAAWLLIPLPMLFHAPFRETLILPLFRHGQALAHDWLPHLVQLAGLGQILLVAGSLAIPSVLGWREQTRAWRPLIRQVFWTYAGYIATTNLCFGLLSVFAPHALLDGSLLATCVTGFITLWWGARLAIQLVWFDRSDAPRVPLAEAALVTLFVSLTAVYATALLHNLAQP